MGGAAEDVGYWDEWGQWIDGRVYDEEGNYVYPDGGAAGQPASPGVGVDPSWYGGGAEAFGNVGGAAAEDNLDGWEQMYDDDGHAYYFNTTRPTGSTKSLRLCSVPRRCRGTRVLG